MLSGISVFVSSGGVVLALFVVGLLVSPQWRTRRSSRLLALLMLLSALGVAHPLVLGMLLQHLAPLRATTLVEPPGLLLGPMMLAYVRRLTGLDTPFRWRRLLHGVPFAGVLVFFLLSGIGSQGLDSVALTTVFWLVLIAQLSVYIVLCFLTLHHYGDALRQQKSNVAGIDLGWLRWLSWLLLGLYVIYTCLMVLVIHRANLLTVRQILSIALTAYVIAFAYRGLVQTDPPLLGEVDAPGQPDEAKYRRAAMAPEETRELRERLDRAMEGEKLFLDPELDLSGLADKVGAARNQLSYVINQGIGKNFYDYVNEFRVREAIRLMQEPQRTNDKVIAIAFDAGFNSKPTFNAVFKKVTGRTPSQYRSTNKKQV